MAYPDKSQQEEENSMETKVETEVLSLCQDTCKATEKQFLAGVTNPEVYLESEDFRGEMETCLCVQNNTGECTSVDSFPAEQRELAVEIALPVPAQFTIDAEEATSESCGGPVFSLEAGEETEEQAVLGETSVSEIADVLETDQKACDTGAWTTFSRKASEPSEPGNVEI